MPFDFVKSENKAYYSCVFERFQVGRLVYELRVGNSEDGNAHIINLDTRYRYYGERSPSTAKYLGLDEIGL